LKEDQEMASQDFIWVLLGSFFVKTTNIFCGIKAFSEKQD